MCEKTIVGKAVVSALLVTALLFVGCGGHSAPPTRSEIAKEMSQPSINNEMRARIVAGGEQLVPVILEEMRAHPKDFRLLHNGWSLVRDMAIAGKADPSAPFIRKVVADSTWPVLVRNNATLMLYWFLDSPPVRKAVAAQCTPKRPKDSDQEMIWETTWRIAQAANMSNKGVVAPTLVKQRLHIESSSESTPFDIIGESSIPLLFREFDAHHDSSILSIHSIVLGMLSENTINLTAPAIRAAMANRRYRPETRAAAAYTLRLFPYSDAVRDASIECINHDPSDKVKAECLGVLWRMVSFDGKRNHWHIDQLIVETLSCATRSPNKNVRLQAKKAVEGIEEQARTEGGVNLEWAKKLLVESGNRRSF